VAAVGVMSWLRGKCKQNASGIYHHLYLRAHFTALKCFFSVFQKDVVERGGGGSGRHGVKYGKNTVIIFLHQ
jgi:hypothetical protein